MLTRLYFFCARTLALAYFITPSWSYILFVLAVSIPYTWLFASLGILLVFFRTYLWLGGSPSISTLGGLTYLTLFLISLRAAVGYWEVYPSDPEGYMKTFALAVIYPWILFLGGEAIALNLDHVRRALWLLFFILLATVLWGSYLGISTSGSFFLHFTDYQTYEEFNYHTLGDALAVVALLLFTPGRRGLFILGPLVAAFLLLLSRSRTSLLAFLGVWALRGALSWALPARFRLGYLVRAGMVASLAILLFLLRGSFLGREFAQEALSRYQGIVSLEDDSVRTRVELLAEFPQLVLRYGLVGRFMYEVREKGKGMYVHSVLSYWLEYGVLIFLLVLTLLGLAFYRVVNCGHPASPLAFNLLVFVTLSVLFSRSYLWPYPWFALGFASALYERRTS